ncbi:MAG: sulfotransferase [Pseudomonadota bacterium]
MQTPYRQTVLLCAMPRSGSTWVAKILDTNRSVVYRHEPDTTERIAVPLVPLAPYSESDRATVADFVARLSAAKPTRVTGKLPLFEKQYHSSLRRPLFGLGVYGAKLLSRGGIDVAIPDLVSRREWSDVTVVWKSIESVARLGLVLAACDALRVVHLLRHPCGHIASVLRGERSGKFSASGASSEDFAIFEMFADTPAYRRFELSPQRLREMTAEERLAWRWALFNDKAIDDNDGNPAYVQLVYEELCADPVGVAQRLFEQCELQWHEQSQAFVAEDAQQDSEEFYSIKRDPAKAAAKWRKELSEDQIERILRVMQQTRSGALFAQ